MDETIKGQPRHRITCRFAAIFLVANSVLAWFHFTEAQQPKKIPRLSILLPSTASVTTTRLEAFHQGLKELGYEEGRNFLQARRYAEAKLERLLELAGELVRLRVDVILTATDPAIRAVKRATQTIPVVMANSIDPVGTGFVETLARPGENITGLTTVARELGTKRLELLKETVPKLFRVAALWNRDISGDPLAFGEMEVAARSLRVQLQSLELRTHRVRERL
jgi:putative tryptophan/tyrosine transport system substrate-binding protein